MASALPLGGCSPRGDRVVLAARREKELTQGATATEFATDPELHEKMAAIAMDPGAVAQTIAWALTQPPEIDVGEIVVRSAAQP